MTVYIWEIRNPDGGSTGLEVARGRCEARDVVLAHALPEEVDVWVTEDAGNLIARAERVRDETSTPMSRLTIRDAKIQRENIWPTDDDLGTPVVLPGGEVGVLTSWWNADDHSEWRWSIELSNHR